ncbi:MAG: ABC transporter substrate-binding protein [Intestinimonas sp.]|jgi:iron complex transport system substrate-binding protein|nr:ABC transporter substrate-binding protein [Intestinimonas sp.]
MKCKKWFSFILVSALSLSLAGCGGGAGTAAGGSAAPTESTPADTITITDQADNTVTVPVKIDRIAVCGIYPLPSVLSVFFHSAEKIVAMPKASMTAAQNSLLGQMYPEILNAQTDCVSGDQVNTEELMKLKPDVVFYSSSDTAIGEQLRNAGFAAVGISVNKWDYNCIETLNQWISLLSEMFPQDAKADVVKQYSDDVYQMIQQRVSSLTDTQRARIFVLFQYSDTTMLSSGKNFFGQWWCDAVGAVNVGEELTTDNSVQVNMEQVYAWNPDVVLVTNFTSAQPENLYHNTIGSYDWSGVAAIQNQRVYKMPLGLYRGYTPGVDTPVTLLWLAKTVYPDLFQDIDVTAKAKDYYKTVFGVDLTDEQVNSIFTPTSAAAGGI